MGKDEELAEELTQRKSSLLLRDPSSAMSMSPCEITSAIKVHTPFDKAFFAFLSSLTLSFNSLRNNVKTSVISLL